MNEHQELAIKALEDKRGDNVARLRAMFATCTPEQMCEVYGRSGRTRAEILTQCEAHDAKIDAAINWVKAQAS